jgi:hypothetical protein
MAYDHKVEVFDGVDTFSTLVDLANSITKVMPHIVFKTDSMQTYYIDQDKYPKGICSSFEVFVQHDLNTVIGEIGVSGDFNKPKYSICNINIDNGRYTYGHHGQGKQSIHLKNIVKVAKNTLKPFSFDQIASRSKRNFEQGIGEIQNKWYWEVRNKTNDSYDMYKDDLEHLQSIGYQPKNPKLKEIMQYLTENKENLDKYYKYNPPHYFVLVKDDQVQYRLNLADKDPCITVPSKDDLPEDIKGKLFVLDITDKTTFVEEVGLKENDGAYWIIA